MNNHRLIYCPECGTQGLTHLKKSVICPVCLLELYFNPCAAVVAVILNPQGQLLVTIRDLDPNQGAWDLPGGFVDPGETAEKAIAREIQEELGVTLKTLNYLGSAPNLDYLYKGITYQTTDLAFVGTIENPNGMVAGDDVRDFLWVTLEHIDLDRFCFESIRHIVAMYKATIG